MDNVPGRPEPVAGEAELQQKLTELAALLHRLRPLKHEPPRPSGRPRCFVIMPFKPAQIQEMYHEFLAPALDECGVEFQRGDDIFGSNVVMDDVLSAIAEADLIIADLSGQNANVFYEVGIAHALGKPVLLLSSTTDDIPYDLRHRRVLDYEYTPVGCKRMLARFKEQVLSMIRELSRKG